MSKLTAVAVKAALLKPGSYQDGNGLFLKVDKRGGASWTLRLQRDGKRQDIGVGSARLLTLADARVRAGELRRAVKVDRRDVLAEKKNEASAAVTFRDAAGQYHAENGPAGRVLFMHASGSPHWKTTLSPSLATSRRAASWLATSSRC